MKPMALKLVSELLRNSRKSDREIAKKMRISQPTVSRMRRTLEKEGVIQEYTIVPDLVKLGYEIVAISSVRAKVKTDYMERARKWVEKHPNIVLMAKAEGAGKNGVVVSLHKNYTEFSRFVTETQADWQDDIETYDTMLIGLKGPVVRAFSLRTLAEDVHILRE